VLIWGLGRLPEVRGALTTEDLRGRTRAPAARVRGRILTDFVSGCESLGEWFLKQIKQCGCSIFIPVPLPGEGEIPFPDIRRFPDLCREWRMAPQAVIVVAVLLGGLISINVWQNGGGVAKPLRTRADILALTSKADFVASWQAAKPPHHFRGEAFDAVRASLR
jgi:hypothetical protein